VFPGEGVDVIENWQVGYRALRLLSPKWVLPVLAELARGAKGHNELARATGTAHRQLDRVLERLAEAGLVERVVDVSRQPLRVRYRLSASGHAAQGPLDELTRWWLKYVEAEQETTSAPGDIYVS
jgi:DNA-binding HxlR family transcriptional regulator